MTVLDKGNDQKKILAIIQDNHQKMAQKFDHLVNMMKFATGMQQCSLQLPTTATSGYRAFFPVGRLP